MIGLLVAGALVLCAGALTVVFGIPIRDFSFGNTMILAGVVIACAGILLLGLALVVREFRALIVAAAAELPEPALSRARPAKPVSSPEGALFTPDQPEDRDNDTSARPSRGPAPAAAKPQRRDFLFSSRRRDSGAVTPPPASSIEEIEPAPPRDTAPELPVRGASPQDPFDSVWPQPSERPRPSFLNRANREPSVNREPVAPERPPMVPERPPRNEEAAVTVIKSGVVDSMAYSLYSDGSIEAHLPEGMVRFESIDDLRSHLDRTS